MALRRRYAVDKPSYFTAPHRYNTLTQDGRGEELRRWQHAGQWVLVNPVGPTWEREVEGRWRRTTIDLVFHRGVKWEPVRGVKLSADHWMVGGILDVGSLGGENRIRAGIDWPRLEALMGDLGEDWYHELAGHNAYEKL